MTSVTGSFGFIEKGFKFKLKEQRFSIDNDRTKPVVFTVEAKDIKDMRKKVIDSKILEKKVGKTFTVTRYNEKTDHWDYAAQMWYVPGPNIYLFDPLNDSYKAVDPKNGALRRL